MSELPRPPLIEPHAPENRSRRGPPNPYQQVVGPVLSGRVRKPRRAAGALQYIGRHPSMIPSNESITIDQESKTPHQSNQGEGGPVMSGGISKGYQAIDVAEVETTEQELKAEKAAIARESASINEEMEAIDAEKAIIEQLELKNPADPAIAIRKINLNNWRFANSKRGNHLGERTRLYKENLAAFHRQTKTDIERNSLHAELSTIEQVAKSNREELRAINAEKAIIAELKRNNADDPQLEAREANLKSMKDANQKLSVSLGKRRSRYKANLAAFQRRHKRADNKAMKKALEEQRRCKRKEGKVERKASRKANKVHAFLNRPISIVDWRNGTAQSDPRYTPMPQQDKLDLFTDLSDSDQSMQMLSPIPAPTGHEHQLNTYDRQVYTPDLIQPQNGYFETQGPARESNESLQDSFGQEPYALIPTHSVPKQASFHTTTFSQAVQNQQVPAELSFNHNGFQPINGTASKEPFVLPSNIVRKIDAWHQQRDGRDLSYQQQKENADPQYQGWITISQFQKSGSQPFQGYGKILTNSSDLLVIESQQQEVTPQEQKELEAARERQKNNKIALQQQKNSEVIRCENEEKERAAALIQDADARSRILQPPFQPFQAYGKRFTGQSEVNGLQKQELADHICLQRQQQEVPSQQQEEIEAARNLRSSSQKVIQENGKKAVICDENEMKEEAAAKGAEEAPKQLQRPKKAKASFLEAKRTALESANPNMKPNRLPARSGSGPYRLTLQERDARRAKLNKILFTPLKSTSFIDLTDDSPDDVTIGASDLTESFIINLTDDGLGNTLMAASSITGTSTATVEEQTNKKIALSNFGGASTAHVEKPIGTSMDANSPTEASTGHLGRETFVTMEEAGAAENNPTSHDAYVLNPAESMIAAADKSFALVLPQAQSDSAMGGI